MKKKLKKTMQEIYSANNTVTEPKKNLLILIIMALLSAAVFGIIYIFIPEWMLLFLAIVVPVAMIGYGIYSYLKENRHDRGAEKDRQEFLSGSKYRNKEWKKAYHQYREKNSFETVSPKGMIYDLKRRYSKQNMWLIRLGILFIIGSVFIFFCPVENKDKVIAAFGIILGAVLVSAGIYDSVAGPVQKFMKYQTNLSEVEKSYMKGRMLSYKSNGINIGSIYTVIYSSKEVNAVRTADIKDMTRKMVRVKKYENSIYSDQEYRYYVRIFYTDSSGNEGIYEVQLDEFQCEMIITELNRLNYPERRYDDISFRITENTVST